MPGAARPGPMGANVAGGGVSFRVWAPDASRIEVRIGDALTPMRQDDAGVWSALVPAIGPGMRYRYRVNDTWDYPDPYSRSQPDGPHGHSEVIDPAAYAWHDAGWRGPALRGLVIYELHVGTYTSAGTFDALIDELEELKRLGVTAIELMPVAEFPGAHNWGYDGVDLFAVSHRYGGPGGLRRLVDAAHGRGMAIILDVVYNHFGPDGNYLLQFADAYLTDRHVTPWGDAINFDGPGSEMVRRFVIDNARAWLSEYHIDGLRLDATFAIVDQSRRHILEELVTEARASAGNRRVLLIGETYENDARYLRAPADGGFGFDAVWADDFHHVVHTIASREQSGYFADYAGTIEELATTINRGWLFQGQHSRHFGESRGTSSEGLSAEQFIFCIQNHDQVGNHAFGRRFSHQMGAGAHRLWSALLLLLPYTPLLFMGQEFAASSRFYYFTDHKTDLGRDVTKGRRAEFARMANFDETQQQQIPDPQAPETFAEARLHLSERDEAANGEVYRMYQALLALRRRDRVLSRQDRAAMSAVACGEHVLLVHMCHGRDHRLIAMNTAVGVDGSAEALGVSLILAAKAWRPVFSTDERRFGGSADQIRFDERLISLPPQSVTWLEATDPTLAFRLLRRMRRIFNSRRNARG